MRIKIKVEKGKISNRRWRRLEVPKRPRPPNEAESKNPAPGMNGLAGANIGEGDDAAAMAETDPPLHWNSINSSV
jgi:hypothetical protein